jgi:hypothetical protein
MKIIWHYLWSQTMNQTDDKIWNQVSKKIIDKSSDKILNPLGEQIWQNLWLKIHFRTEI